MLKVSVSGVRGIWGEDLTHENILLITKSFVQVLGKNKKIAIATDTRQSATSFKMLVSSVLMSYGYNIIDLGVLATPLTLFAVKHMDLDGGIVLTASHNPMEWNAFKFVNKEGLFFSKEEMASIQKNMEDPETLDFSIKDTGSLQTYSYLFPYYLDFIAPYFAIESIRKHKFKVVADVVNGAMGVITPKLFDFLNIDGEIIHKELNRPFERTPEPKPGNLEALSHAVIENKADIGFAFDPDGDRLALINEKGEALDTNWVLIIAYLYFLEYGKQEKKDIAINYSSSMILQELAQKNGAHAIKTPVGEINVTNTMLSQDIHIGGEGNGGVIFPEVNSCRDAVVGVFFVLDYLSKKNLKLSEVQASLEWPITINISREWKGQELKINEIKTLIEKMLASLSIKKFSINTSDGVFVDYQAGWLQVRLSNTEPIIRIMGESRDPLIHNPLLESIEGIL